MIFGAMPFILIKKVNLSARKKWPEIAMIVKRATLGIKCFELQIILDETKPF
jgi:hypothetical protein